MKNISIVFSLAFLLSACASPPRYGYVKEGASAHDTTNSTSECQYQIRLNKTPQTEADGLMKLCMQGKGFRVKRVN